MISSRWPRPIGIIPSIDLRPVWTGSFTGWRWTTPGALNSAGQVSDAFSSPLSSSGRPSGSTRRPEQLLADQDLEQAPGALHGVALHDLLPLAEQHRADVVLLQVQRQAGDAVRQLEHLEGHAVLEAVDAGDAVRDLEHGADLGELGLARLQPLDAFPKDVADLVWTNLHVSVSS